MRKLTKTALAVAAIAAVSLGSYWAYSVKVVGGMSQEDFLIIENVEALSQNSSGDGPGLFSSRMSWASILSSGMAGIERTQYEVTWKTNGTSQRANIWMKGDKSFYVGGEVEFHFMPGVEYNKKEVPTYVQPIGSYFVCSPAFSTCDRCKQKVPDYNASTGEVNYITDCSCDLAKPNCTLDN